MSERSHFIPLRRQDLVQKIQGERSSEDFDELARLIHHVIRFEADERAEVLRETYAPFDPDPEAEGVHGSASEEAFLEHAEEVLTAANFRRVTDDELEAALNASSLFPLLPHVDTSGYEILRLYRRGQRDVEETEKGWRTLWKEKVNTIHVWERLVIILRLKPDALEEATARTSSMRHGQIYLKLFKNIPQNDVEMVLPNTKLKLRGLDRAMIGGPVVAGIGWTIFQSIGILAAVASGAFALSLDDPRLKALGGVLVVLGGYLWKTHNKVKTTRLRYMQTLSQGLYFLNLANNRSVLHQLLAFARDSDEKEALLAYHILEAKGPMPKSALDKAAEAWIRNGSGRQSDFDVKGAVENLTRWGIVSAGGDALQALPVRKAGKRLVKLWAGEISP
ncbi:MAG: DUF3754 domain-containing protein [Thermoplasmatota archaeon]